MSNNLKDTICAISTPVGEAGIGIVRLSGSKALKIADRIFLPGNGKKPSKMSGYMLHYGHIAQPSSGKSKAEVIDEVLLAVMRAPKSYTKEDVVEINAHGGIACLKKILSLVVKKGARLAQPGEFTKRAFLNGRLDLSQAEAVLDMINAKTEDSLRAAALQLEGVLSKAVKGIRGSILEIHADIEALLDFPDEELDIAEKNNIRSKLNRIISALKQLLKESAGGRILREGITCVICGKPNVGKSTIMNRLLKQERVIVTAVAGTTRDAIEETVNLNGIALKIVDTAGIVEPEDEPSKAGILLSRKYIDNADLILLVIDAGSGLKKEDLEIINSIASKKALVALNKIDLTAKIKPQDIKKYLAGKKIVKISAKKNIGIRELENAIRSMVWSGGVSSASHAMITNVRHEAAAKQALRALEEAVKGINTGAGEITALSLKQAGDALGLITGEVLDDDLLDRIFSKFCIGK
ncbi:MAG: tRNA uridine-5-carboxymethylaminomethyl(34) synthesis GTPase MnmE [Candidatus Omnitrophica bacterium]|nr:tRNA uridine-5-carboxymethylaminomethyl(34) synthesis GTPase MnmE [Candidatus Omnitrophota bacterium]